MNREIDGLNTKQRELLDAIIATGGLISACKRLEIYPSVAYQRLYRLRNKYEVEKRFIETYDRYKIRTADKVGLYL